MVDGVGGILRDGQPPLNRSSSSAAAALIREAVLDGRLRPGQRLTEEALARELSISRTPVREALRILQTEGLLELTPYQGTTVRSYDAADLDDMYRLRALLEGYAARRAAEEIMEDALDGLRESNERFAALTASGAADVQELVRENLFFHNTILEAAGSPRLSELVRKVIELPLVYKSYVWYSPTQRLVSNEAHRRLVEALAAHDPDAAERLMKEHVDAARAVLLEHLRSVAEAEELAEAEAGAPAGAGAPAEAGAVAEAGEAT